MRFCDDVDLLKWEPELFKDLAWMSQVLCQSDDGALQGSSFSTSSGNFSECGVSAGQVIYLCDSVGKVDGCYEVVSVDSATELTISVLRANKDDAVVGVPADVGTGTLTFRICTYGPQAEIAGEILLNYFGMRVADVSQSSILNVEDLRLVSVFSVLSSVFAGLYGNKSQQGYRDKSQYYRGMYHLARGRLALELDVNSDGVAETVVKAGEVELRRA